MDNIENTVDKIMNVPEQISYNAGVWRGDGVPHTLTKNEQKKRDRMIRKQGKIFDVHEAREQAEYQKNIRIQKELDILLHDATILKEEKAMNNE